MSLRIVAAALLVLLAPLTVHAQHVLQGRLVDARGAPLPREEVVLHAVTDAGGSALARTESDADGRFRFEVPAASGRALYFAATQLDGRVYLGPALDDPSSDVSDYELRVSPATSVDAMTGQATTATTTPADPPASARQRLAWLVFAPLVLGALVIGARTRRDPGRERREMLRELAALRDADGAAEADRRATIRARLTGA